MSNRIDAGLQRVASVLLACGLAACSSSGDDVALDAGRDAVVDTGLESASDAPLSDASDAGSDVVVDTSVESATDAGDEGGDAAGDAVAPACIELTLGRLGTNTVAVAEGRFAPQLGSAAWDVLSVAVQGGTGSFDLSLASEHEQSSCQHCVYVQEDVDATTGAVKTYLARSGTVALTAVGDGGVLIGSLTDVTLAEADWTGASTVWAPGGACLHITAASFDTTPTFCVPFGSPGCSSGQECVVPWLSMYPVRGVCLDVGANAAGASCADASSTTSTDCVAGYLCSGGALDNEQRCRALCDPFGDAAQACPDAGDTCDPMSHTCSLHTVDPAAVGEPCDAASFDYTNCAPGNGRAAGLCSSGTCREVCRIEPSDGGSTSPDCSGGESCVDVFGTVLEGVCQ